MGAHERLVPTMTTGSHLEQLRADARCLRKPARPLPREGVPAAPLSVILIRAAAANLDP
jgi:hypothetical protein